MHGATFDPWTRWRAMRTACLCLGLAVMAVLVLLRAQGTPPLLPSATELRTDADRPDARAIAAREEALPSDALPSDALPSDASESAPATRGRVDISRQLELPSRSAWTTTGRS
jgi:hypothetical protein